MLDGFKSLVDSLRTLAMGEEVDPHGEHARERLAVAALLVHAATADGAFDEAEAAVLLGVLEEHYGLDRDEAETLLDEARAREAEAVDIYRFTHVIQTTLSQEERQAIIRLMWRVALADGAIHEFEGHLIWRTAELIGVSTRDRVRLRQAVQAETEASAGHG